MARILGLDISDTAVRGALVTTTLRTQQVSRYVEVPIAPPTEGEDQPNPLHAAVQELLGALDPPPDSIIVALDGRQASLRTLDLPAGAAKRVAEVLPFELEPILPFPIEEAVIDHQVVERTPTTLRLLTAAVPKERVAARLAALREAGLEPRQMAVGGAALDGLVPLLPALSEEGAHILVHLDDSATDVCIVRSGQCQLARTLSGGMRDVRSGRRAHLESQLRHTLAGYRGTGGATFSRAFLAGEAAMYPQALEWLQGVLEVETQVLPLPPVPGADDAHRPLFGRATALAGRVLGRGKHLDLRRGEFAPQRTANVLRKHARLAAICAGVVFASFVFSVYARWTVLADERQVLGAQLEAVTEDLFDKPTADPVRAREILEGKKGPEDPLPRFDAYDALESISELIPEELTHKHDTRRLQIDFDDEAHEGRFDLQGTVASVAERDRVADALEGHPCFHDLEKGRTTPGPGNEGLNYQLEAIIRCPGAPTSDKADRGRRRGTR
jgi:general secretion pathway protein L